MKILIAGGTGFVGQHLIPALVQQQHDITVLGRDLAKINKTFSNTVQGVEWQQLDVHSLSTFDAIINLSGYSIGDKRWSPSVKQLIKTSRVETTRKLALLCAELGNTAPRLLNASAIGIYGLTTQRVGHTGPAPLLDETSAIPFGQPTDFLSEVGQEWESALMPAIEAGCAVTIMRFGVVLGKAGGVLARLLPTVKLGLASVLGSGNQGFSWIAMPDLVAAVEFLLAQRKLQGPFNVTSPHPLSQRDFIKALAVAYHRPCFLTAPAPILKLIMGQMADELLLQGQWIYPQRLLTAGFMFRHDPIEKAVGP